MILPWNWQLFGLNPLELTFDATTANSAIEQ